MRRLQGRVRGRKPLKSTFLGHIPLVFCQGYILSFWDLLHSILRSKSGLVTSTDNLYWIFGSVDTADLTIIVCEALAWRMGGAWRMDQQVHM